jgi:hypothetical protein
LLNFHYALSFIMLSVIFLSVYADSFLMSLCCAAFNCQNAEHHYTAFMPSFINLTAIMVGVVKLSFILLSFIF